MFAKCIVDVANSNVDKIFEYNVPKHLNISKGDRVLLPFGNRVIEGYVIALESFSEYPLEKIKDIKTKLDNYPLIKEELIDLCFYLRQKNHLRMVDTIKLCIPYQIRKGTKEKLEKFCILTDDEHLLNEFITLLRKNSKNILACINYLKNIGRESLSKLNNKFSNFSVSKLIDNKILIVQSKIVYRKTKDLLTRENKKVVLTKNQNEIVKKITLSKFDTFLLHGVTGSGKTEVYLNIIEKCINNGKTAIMLVPEISLTPQMASIFESRFGSNVAVLHSGLSNGEKFDEWNKIYKREVKIVIGARSAIFAPVENLGVIIIDEEHDNSYISETNPRYNTADVATFRAKYNNCPILLGSATPSVETYLKAQKGEYSLLELPNRVNNKEMPKIQIVDMCSEFRNGNLTPFSETLIQALDIVVKEKKQAILFINRRGFSSFMMCRECGYIPKCENCDSSLVFHKQENVLKCHFCGQKYKALTQCVCGSESIKLGAVGTQKVVEELNKLYPKVKIFRMDNDSTVKKNAFSQILNEFSDTLPSILVGTQMVAKGHDFPDVSLVGVLDADLSLFFSDYKATEKTFQLITQVSGRAGRSETEGSVVLQTYFPKHYVYNLVANYNYKKFFDKEINLRQVTLFPPFSKLVRVLFSDESEDRVKNIAIDCFNEFKKLRIEYKDNFYFLEAMRSPINKIKNKYRYQLVMRYTNSQDLEEIITDKIFQIVDRINNNKISSFIEINPQNLS